MKSAVKVPRLIVATSALAGVLGILLSVYAYHVETAHEADPTFKALCDISETMSCTKVFSSRWGRGFGLMPKDSIFNQPNSVLGMGYYLIQSLLAFNTTYIGALIQLSFSTTSIIGCIYLAYILFFVLKDVCVVCISMYVVSFIIFVCCILKYRAISSAQASRATADERKKKK